MKIFIDESGSFGWNPTGISLFCAVTIADRELSECEERFLRWKQRCSCLKSIEAKGNQLSLHEQTSFVQTVLLPSKDFWITLVGTNTQTFERDLVNRVKYQQAEVLKAAENLCAREGNAFMAREYSELSGWMRNRSPENLVWIETLSATIFAGLQHSIVRFLDVKDDPEFDEVGILIDRSFVKQKEHIQFWHEHLRNRLYNISIRRRLVTPRQWNDRNHPFTRQYSTGKGVLVTTDLFRNNMRFEDSKTSAGLQLADICANIAFRFYSRSPKYRPFRLMRSRIVRMRGKPPLHLMGFAEESLLTDAPENHVKTFSLEQAIAARQSAKFA